MQTNVTNTEQNFVQTTNKSSDPKVQGLMDQAKSALDELSFLYNEAAAHVRDAVSGHEKDEEIAMDIMVFFKSIGSNARVYAEA